MLFDRSNLPYWIFLGTGITFFLFVIAVGGGNDDLDLDVDVDIDADIDGEIDVDTEIEADSELGVLHLLAWLGIGKAPLILLLATDLSLWGIIGWILNVLTADFFKHTLTGFTGTIVMFGSMGIALLTGSVIARPLGQVFAAFGEDAKSDRLIGCIGTVSSATIPSEQKQKIGQVNVVDSARNLVTVNAVLPSWATVIPRYGEQVLIIDYQGQHYLAIAENSADYDYWFEQVSTRRKP